MKPAGRPQVKRHGTNMPGNQVWPVPRVLTIGFRERDPSPRWKQVVEAAPGRFTKHLEMHSVADLDDEASAWLRAAWMVAG
jgi:hypothetical protein